jgi:hypothetical protein
MQSNIIVKALSLEKGEEFEKKEMLFTFFAQNHLLNNILSIELEL